VDGLLVFDEVQVGCSEALFFTVRQFLYLPIVVLSPMLFCANQTLDLTPIPRADRANILS